MKPAVWTGMRITLLAGLLLIAAACQRTPPEEALRARMSVLESAIDARDAGALRDFLADDFIGPGGMDGTGARRLAQGLFLRYRDIGTRLGPLDVQVQEQHATVRFDAIVTGGAGSLLPDSGQVYDVRTAWRLEGGEWVLVSAEWAPGMAGQ
jgi:hypothetical protein